MILLVPAHELTMYESSTAATPSFSGWLAPPSGRECKVWGSRFGVKGFGFGASGFGLWSLDETLLEKAMQNAALRWRAVGDAPE